MGKFIAILNSALLLVTLNGATQCGGNNAVDLEYEENATGKFMAQPYVYPDTSFHFYSAVTVIFEDSRSLIWIGSKRNGVTLYDGKSSYTNFLQLDGKNEMEVLDIQEDAFGTIWIQTTASLNKIDGTEIKRFPLENGVNSQEEAKINYTITENWDVKPNDLWFRAGADGTVARVRNSSIDLLKLPKQTDEKSLNYNPNWVFSTLKGKNNHVWFGTISSGVLHYDGTKFNQIKIPASSGVVVSIFNDRNEKLWIGTNKGGLYTYENKVLTDFAAQQNLNLTNPDYSPTGIWNIEEDAEGNIWFATMFKGALMYNGNEIKVFNMDNGLPTNTLQSITKATDGTLWIGTLRGGLIKYNGSTFILTNSNNLDDC